jgi:hypothetical protein
MNLVGFARDAKAVKGIVAYSQSLARTRGGPASFTHL